MDQKMIENDSGPALPNSCGVLCGLGTLESKGLAVRNVSRCLCAVHSFGRVARDVAQESPPSCDAR